VKQRSKWSLVGIAAVAVVVLITASLAVAGATANSPVFKKLPNGLVNYKLSKFYGPCKRQYTVYEFQAHRADAWAQSTAKEVKAYGASHCLKVINQDAGGYQFVSKQLDQLGVRGLVSFERAEWEDLPGLAAASDVAVTIADSDSTPASLLEVMASRVPVVAGRTWSIDEWIGPGEGGELVECRDEDAVAGALAELLRDPELRRRYGERNERFVREKLGDPGEQLEGLYRELLER